MNQESPLTRALDWFFQQDDKGGFKTAAGMLFPEWKLKRSCRAPHRADRNPSFSVYKSAEGHWRFKDHSTDEHGGLVGFVMLAGMDEKQAARWLMDRAGIAAVQPVHCPLGAATARQANEPNELPVMPPEVMEIWSEGVDYLQAKPERIEALAVFRGWPKEWAQYLADCAIVSMPLYHRARTIAFLVSGPSNMGTTMVMRDFGFHCRLKPQQGQKKFQWRFVPSEKEHGQSIPALPFIIGGTSFNSSSLLVVTEGQWDALTFSFVAGWLGEGCKWPEGVCVIGIRGVSGINTFLRHYEQFWPRNLNCLLLPDTDGAGSKWFDNRDSFSDRLAKLCRKVAVVGCGRHKDFNDLYRAEKVTPDQIGELLTSHGMALEGRVTS